MAALCLPSDHAFCSFRLSAILQSRIVPQPGKRDFPNQQKLHFEEWWRNLGVPVRSESTNEADADSPKTHFTDEELQVKFLPDSGENSLKY